MENSKNVYLAVILFIVFMISWNVFYVEPMKKEMIEYQQKHAVVNSSQATPQQEVEIKQVVEVVTRDEALEAGVSGQRVSISNGKIKGSILLQGARFDDVTLSDYHVTIDKTSPEVSMFSPSNTSDAYFAELGWLSSLKSVKTPDSKSVWKANKSAIEAGDELVLTWDNKQGLIFRKEIILDDNYMFLIKDSVRNEGSSDVKLFSYGRINRVREYQSDNFYSHEGMVGVTGDVLEEYSYGDVADEDNQKVTFKDTTGWIGIADKYWLTALIPTKGSKYTFNTSYKNNYSYSTPDAKPHFQTDFLGQAVMIGAGEEKAVTNRLFVGAKKVELLDEYEADLQIALFGRSIDFGMLYFISKPLFTMLAYFEKAFGNFGLAVLMLTVVVKLLLFPLANKSYRSMARMRTHMPEMKAMRDKYKDDRVKLNQEMMSFYKKNKVNPLSGCLPILIQLPIFFALYRLLLVTIDMRHAPFYGWVVDLSVIDPTNIFNLFGLIDWTPPELIPSIGVLPILFMITMYIQQKLSPPPTDPTQAMVMKFLPLIFVLLFASFPAGLVIYWLWSNVLSILQQWIIIRAVERDEAKKNIAKAAKPKPIKVAKPAKTAKGKKK